jgi:hypothetical protein
MGGRRRLDAADRGRGRCARHAHARRRVPESVAEEDHLQTV